MPLHRLEFEFSYCSVFHSVIWHKRSKDSYVVLCARVFFIK